MFFWLVTQSFLEKKRLCDEPKEHLMCGVGPRRAESQEKSGGRREKRGREAGCQRRREPEEIEKNFAKEMGQIRENHSGKGRKARVEDTGSWRFRLPLSPPTEVSYV